MIQITGLRKSYGKNRVLENLSCTFEKGKVYGVVGRNGAGKTTLFRCIAGLEDYDGNIESDFPILKNHLGFLPTNPYLLPKITGREFIQLWGNARQVSLPDLDAQNIFDLPLDQYAETYSTGMKKKLALLAILFQGNDVFVLDEPFNGVDMQSNLIITELIQTLRNLGKIIIISSHILVILREVCDKIHLLENGNFAQSFRPDELSQLDQGLKANEVDALIRKLNLK